MKEAPLFVRAYDLHSWLLDRFAGVDIGHEVRRAVLTQSEALLAAVSLAVARFDPADHLAEADARATLLRVHLRLAAEKRLLSDRQLLFANEALRDIGRQIGGWRRHLDEVA